MTVFTFYPQEERMSVSVCFYQYDDTMCHQYTKNYEFSHTDISDWFSISHQNNSWWDVGFVADSIVKRR